MTAEQRKALKDRDLDAEIEEKLAMIVEGEKTVAELKQEAERLSIIVIQRRMDLGVLDQMEEAFHAAVAMFGAHYRHEINTGQHGGKSVGHLLRKYLNRERNLVRMPGWRFSLARWLTRSQIDREYVLSHVPYKPVSQLNQGGDNV